MNREEQGSAGGGDDRREAEQKPADPQGGLGILFLAAALALVLILSFVGMLAYFAMK